MLLAISIKGEEAFLRPTNVGDNKYEFIDKDNKPLITVEREGDRFAIKSLETIIDTSRSDLQDRLNELFYAILEVENNGGDINDQNIPIVLDNPYDPELIRVESKNISLRQIYDMIKEGDIDISPDFQRNFVWDTVRKSRLIESILLRIPLPVFYFSHEKDGRLSVVDGLQRLSTIRDFMNNEFRLQGLEYLKESCERHYYKREGYPSLEPRYLRYFNLTNISANIIDKQSPPKVKFDIFRRINTGGKPLNAQEIRNSLATSQLRSALREMVGEHSPFQEATEGSVGAKRMDDQELALRFLAFNRLYQDSHDLDSYDGNMENTLDEEINKLNGIDQNVIDNQVAQFDNAMRCAKYLFGAYAFRKCLPQHLKPGERRQVINKALFLVWALLLAGVSYEKVILLEEGTLALDLAKMIEEDNALFAYLTYGTNGKANLKYIFGVCSKLLNEKIYGE